MFLYKEKFIRYTKVVNSLTLVETVSLRAFAAVSIISPVSYCFCIYAYVVSRNVLLYLSIDIVFKITYKNNENTNNIFHDFHKNLDTPFPNGCSEKSYW